VIQDPHLHHPIRIALLMRAFILYTLLSFLLVPQAVAQKRQVQLIQADQMSFDKARSEVRVVTGKVIFEHDSALLYCDSALFNEVSNHVEAYGNVHIRVNDSLSIYGRELLYEGGTRIADMRGDVRLIDNRTTLLTPSIRFNRNTSICSYTEGGRITDRRNELTSLRGSYYTPDKQFYFRDSVRLHNPRYDMVSDTLHYNTQSEVAEFFGHTIITSKENTIVCNEGWYDTGEDLASFSKRASIRMEDRVLWGDSLFYDRVTAYGEAYRNIRMVDAARDMEVQGHVALYHEAAGYAIVTDSALAILAGEDDSLFLHGDTLWAVFDTTGETQELYCYHHAKFFRPDLQGMADSLAYLMADSAIFLHGRPAIWSEAHQLTGDTIRIDLANDAIHQVHLLPPAFIASMEDTNAYNQLKGTRMTGFFRDNEMVRMEIYGNAETIYYVREEDGRLSGINKAVSSDITIRLEDRKIVEILYINQPEAVLYPPSQFPAQDRFLEGFEWRSHRRPRQPGDVFRW